MAFLRRKAVLSFTTKFQLPHEGMEQLEYLSRGSAFLLDVSSSTSSTSIQARRQASSSSSSSLSRKELVVLTCQHVCCPWLFPNYFQDKWHWLQFVNEDFVQHSLQLIDLPVPGSTSNLQEPPKVLVEIPLENHITIHPTRDMAYLQLASSSLTSLMDEDVSPFHLEMSSDTDPDATIKQGLTLEFHGHTQSSSSCSGEEEIYQWPKQVKGHFVGQTPQGQAFAWSEEVLEEGMCGGVVTNASNGDVVGLIEGIVPPFQRPPPIVVSSNASEEELKAIKQQEQAIRMKEILANHVAFIPFKEIQQFVMTNCSKKENTGLFTGNGLIS